MCCSEPRLLVCVILQHLIRIITMDKISNSCMCKASHHNPSLGIATNTVHLVAHRERLNCRWHLQKQRGGQRNQMQPTTTPSRSRFANFEITRPTARHCNVWWLQTCRGRESRSEHHLSVVFACRPRAKDGNRRAISENLSPAIVTCASWSQERSGVAFTLHKGSATDERDESA